MKKLGKRDLIYFLIFIIALAVIIINRCFMGFGNIVWLADFGSIFGILYVIYGAKHSILMHVFNLISTIFIAITNFIQRVYFNAFFAALVAIPLIIWGIFNWKNNEKIDEKKNLQKLTKRGYVILASLFVVVLPVIIIILWKLNTNLFYLDATFTSLCFMGLILSSHMYIEQFVAFIAADFFQMALYIMLTIQNFNNFSYLFMTLVMLTFNIIALINWINLYKNQRKIISESGYSDEVKEQKTDEEEKVQE